MATAREMSGGEKESEIQASSVDDRTPIYIILRYRQPSHSILGHLRRHLVAHNKEAERDKLQAGRTTRTSSDNPHLDRTIKLSLRASHTVGRSERHGKGSGSWSQRGSKNVSFHLSSFIRQDVARRAPQARIMQIELSSSKQSTLMGFFGKPKAGPPRSTSNTSLSRATLGVSTTQAPSTQKVVPATAKSSPVINSKPPSSVPGSSPTLVDREHDGVGKRQSSPLGGGRGGEESDLSPPPSSPRSAIATSKMRVRQDDGMDIDDEPQHPPSSPIVTVSITHQ